MRYRSRTGQSEVRNRSSSVQLEMRPLDPRRTGGQLGPPVNQERRRGSFQKSKKSSKRQQPRTNSELFDEAVADKKSMKSLPIPLKEKRRLLKEKNIDPQRMDADKNQISNSVSKLYLTLQSIWKSFGEFIEPWTRQTKYIEGRFGTGVGSYFRLLRTFLYINVSVTIITFLALLIPVISDSERWKITTNTNEVMGFHFKDIFLGTGYFENSLLFYGSGMYTQYVLGNTTSDGWFPNYSIPKGYFWTTGFGYSIFIISILVNFVSVYKRSFIDNAEFEGKQFGTTVFASWQMSIHDASTAEILRNKITEDLNKLNKQKAKKNKENRKEKKEDLQKYLIPRFVTFAIVLGIIGGTCYGIFELLNFSKVVYIIPLILSFIVVFVPWMLRVTIKVTGVFVTLIKLH